MKNYDFLILNKLIDKYESSRHYGDPEKILRGIFFYFREKYIPDYFVDTTAEYKNTINATCKELQARGFIQIYWKKHEEGNLIDKVRLDLTSLKEIYEYLGRKPKLIKEATFKNLIGEYHRCRPGWLQEFYQFLLSRIEEHKNPVYIDLENKEQAEDIFKTLNSIVELDGEVPIRIFSVRILNDSKRFRQIESRVVRILKDFSPEIQEDWDNKSVLAEFGLLDNPQYINLSGNLTFKYNGREIRVSDFEPDVGLPVEMIEGMEIIALDVDYIITIENLTPYQQFIRKNSDSYLAIYLGGFHNRWRRKLLVKLKEFIESKESGGEVITGYPVREISFKHWGDIDLGGFLILKHLRETTGIDFRPYQMDVETLKRHSKQARSLPDHAYKQRLRELLKVDDLVMVHETVRYMLENEVMLEQEALESGIHQAKP